MKSITQNGDPDNNEFTVSPELVNEGFWLTMGLMSVKIRKTDEGIVIDAYPKGLEDRDAIASTYVFDSEVTEAISDEQPELNGHRVGVGEIPCKYCDQKDCDFSCDESQAGGFTKQEGTTPT